MEEKKRNWLLKIRSHITLIPSEASVDLCKTILNHEHGYAYPTSDETLNTWKPFCEYLQNINIWWGIDIKGRSNAMVHTCKWALKFNNRRLLKWPNKCTGAGLNTRDNFSERKGIKSLRLETNVAAGSF